MTGRHRRTLERIFTHPTPANIRWSEVEALMRALGVEVVQRSGSRVLFRRRVTGLVVHRPHPGNEVDRNTIRSIADFLQGIGETP